tara:strand:- start:2641 stop:3402 length:762 start_codon:yes stop_codon:yes gene_type:complete
MRERIVKGVTHYLYDDVNEFREHHEGVALVTDWRHSNKGDWILTDDGQVCQVLFLGILKKKDRKKETSFIRSIMGSYVCNPSVMIEGDMKTNMHTFSTAGESPSVRKKNRKHATDKEFLFGKYVAKGDDVVEAYMKAFPSKNENYAKSQAKLLLKTDRVKNLIREEIDKYLNEAEITPNYLLEEMRDIIDKGGSSDRDKITAITTLMKISGMMDTEKTTESLTLFQGFTKEQLNAIQGSQHKKLAEVKKDNEK